MLSFATYDQFLKHLDGLGLFHMHPSLNNISQILDALCLRRPEYLVVQLVGTNGKGSTSSLLASLAQAHGNKTGLFTSPHFIDIRERVRIDGKMLDERLWLEHANKVMEAGGEILSYFELIMAMAVSMFAEQGVTCAIMEAGLGGTWDATTALGVDLTVFTPIAMDHVAVLGNTLTAIARDKAGAIRENTLVCSAEQQKEADETLRSIAAQKNAPFFTCGQITVPQSILDGSTALQLGGNFQIENIRLALLAWRELNLLIEKKQGNAVAKCCTSSKPEETESQSLIIEGLKKAWIPGRMQRVPASFGPSPLPGCKGWPFMMLDGAHNVHAMEGLGLSLAKENIAPLAVIFSCLEDKNPEKLIPQLRALATGPIFVPPIKNNPRAIAPEALAKKIGINAVPVRSLHEALFLAVRHIEERMPEAFLPENTRNPLLLCGSLYLLGEFYALRPELLEPACE